MLREIVKGGSLILFGTLVVKFLSFLYFPILARVLGPTKLGLYNLALVMLPWFVSLISLSLATIVAQTIAENLKKKEKLASIITTYIYFTLILSLVGGLLHLLFAKLIAVQFFNSVDLINFLRLASGGVAIALIYNTALGIARGLKDFKLYSQMEVIKSIMYVGLGLLFLLYFNYEIKGAIFAIIFAPVVPILHLVIKHKKYLVKKVDFGIVTNNLRVGLWITLLSFILTVLLTADKFFLGMFTNPAVVGLYAAASVMIIAVHSIAASFKGSLLPFINENFDDTGKIRVTIEKMVTYTLILMGAILFLIVAFREEIVFLLFGREYLFSASIVPILALTTLPYTIYIILHTVILNRRLVAKTTKQLFFVAVIALIIDAMLVKNFAAFGAAFGIIISHSLVATIYIRILKKEFNLRVSSLVGLALATATTITIAIFLPNFLWYKIPLFLMLAALYLVFLLKCNYVTKKEVNILLGKFKRMITP